MHAARAIGGMLLRISDVKIARSAESNDETKVVTRDVSTVSVMHTLRECRANPFALGPAPTAVSASVLFQYELSGLSPCTGASSFPRLTHSDTRRANSSLSESTDTSRCPVSSFIVSSTPTDCR
jgi:hypothetical protein